MAQALVRETGNLPVPLALRNAPTKLMKNLNYGQGYQYAHDAENNFANMEFLPEEISGTKHRNRSVSECRTGPYDSLFSTRTGAIDRQDVGDFVTDISTGFPEF